MDYYRPNMSGSGGGGGVIPSQNYADANSMNLNSASDSYAPDYWTIPYTDGLSPMKQIEGNFLLLFSLFQAYIDFFIPKYSGKSPGILGNC